MKRINKWTYLLAAALLFSACGSEETFIPTPEDEGEQTVKIALNIDTNDADGVMTRAGGNSAVPEGYRLRYIIAAYDWRENADGDTLKAEPIVKETEYADDLQNITGTLRLMAGRKYAVVAWADYVKTDAQTKDVYYDTAGWPIITAKTGTTAIAADNKDAEDAYTAKVMYTAYTAETEGPQSLVLTLKRPLTKVCLENISITGEAQSPPFTIKCQVGEVPEAGTNGTETVGNTEDPKQQSFNVLTQEVSGQLAESTTFTMETAPIVTSPYIYFFNKSTSTVKLHIEDENAVKYGLKAAGNSIVGSVLTLQLVKENTSITIRRESGGTELPFYPFPTAEEEMKLQHYADSPLKTE